MNVLPPHPRPDNESAGYLGYYTRRWLPAVFDLVDIDGTWPTAWTYYKSAERVLRIIEEKPYGQGVHPSQSRVFRVWFDLIDLGIKHRIISPRSAVFIIYEAERLVEPTFPIRVQRFSAREEQFRSMNRREFDAWLMLEQPEERAA